MTIAALREIDYQLGGTTLNEFAKKAHGTAVYPGMNSVRGFEYCMFGAGGELGEAQNKYKKILRSERDLYVDREIIMDELMDSVWYHVEMLRELGYTFEEGAEHLINKLAARKAAGELKEHK